jgi:hypothetical protein
MDAEAIQEIANKLGITVDAVTKKVIPAFAQFETANYTFGAILFGCLFALTLTLTIFFIKKGIIEKRNGDLNQDYDSSLYFIIGAIAGFCATVFFVLLFCSISSITLWVYYPYSSFINYILN